MPSLESSDRAIIGRIGAHTRWANTPDRSIATAPARSAFMRGFDKAVDPDGILAPDERARRAKSARKAYMLGLARKSAQARRVISYADPTGETAVRNVMRRGAA